MGYNDRDPGLYEAITGLAYETDLPLDGSKPRVPAGWTPPPMPLTCSYCQESGDEIRDGFRIGECYGCSIEVCRECGDPDDDESGTTYLCYTCRMGGESA